MTEQKSGKHARDETSTPVDAPAEKRAKLFHIVKYPAERDQYHNAAIVCDDGTVCFPLAILYQTGHIEGELDIKKAYTLEWKGEKVADVNEYLNFIATLSTDLWVKAGCVDCKIRAAAVAYRQKSTFGSAIADDVAEMLVGTGVLMLPLVYSLVDTTGVELEWFAEKYLNDHSIGLVVDSSCRRFWDAIESIPLDDVEPDSILDRYISVYDGVSDKYIDDVASRMASDTKENGDDAVRESIESARGIISKNLTPGSRRKLLLRLIDKLQ